MDFQASTSCQGVFSKHFPGPNPFFNSVRSGPTPSWTFLIPSKNIAKQQTDVPTKTLKKSQPILINMIKLCKKIQSLSQNCPKFASKLSQNCLKVISEVSQI